MPKIVDIKMLRAKNLYAHAALLDCGHVQIYREGLSLGQEVFCEFCIQAICEDHKCAHCGQPAARCWMVPAGPRYGDLVWLCRFCDTPAGRLLAQYPNQVDAETVLAHVSAVAHKLAEELKR
jgi:hypothetical protein